MPVEASLSLEEVRTLADQDLVAACDQARSLVAAQPDDEAAAALLSELVRRFAASAPARPDRAEGLPPELTEAAEFLSTQDDERAEIIIRAYLARHPNDVRAMSMMAEIAARCDLFDNAERILQRALQINPKSVDVLLTYAKLVNHLSFLEHGEDRGSEALKLLDRALEIEPDNVKVVSLYSSIQVSFRRLEESVRWYERLLVLDPLHWYAWTNFGTMLGSLGRFGQAVACIRTSIALNPLAGNAWWELANLKIARLFAADIDAMKAALESPELSEGLRAHIHFALAKAFEQAKDFASAAEQLRLGNKLKAAEEPHDAEALSQDAAETCRIFTGEFFEQRKDMGDRRADPIFIVGLQRSGTTLVEQILASHSQIEGTEELFVTLQIAREMTERHAGMSWQEALAARPAQDLSAMGAGLLRLSNHYRVKGLPFYIDKNPTNWRLAGLIATILPNAKIIAVRRNPMDCCFANYAQNYENGLGFSYSQAAVGRFYADYIKVMRHFEREVPGRIHQVIYEDMVDDLESSVRAMLDYIGVPFEESCLRFYETDRAVLTPSAQQVRQPINRSGIGKWKPYEPWLGELKDALGATLTDWRD